MRKNYIIKSDLQSVNAALDVIGNDVCIYFSKRHLKEFLLGLYELFVNAVEHGNLGITYDMKKQWIADDTYDIKLKDLSSKFGDKEVSVNLTVDNGVITVQTKDQGNGFDISKAKKIISSDDIFRENGRGMIMMEHFFDSVVYNDKGNEVTVAKKLDKELKIM